MKLKKPNEFTPRSKKDQVCARIKVESKATLQKMADKQGMPLGELLANILEDYVNQL